MKMQLELFLQKKCINNSLLLWYRIMANRTYIFNNKDVKKIIFMKYFQLSGS